MRPDKVAAITLAAIGLFLITGCTPGVAPVQAPAAPKPETVASDAAPAEAAPAGEVREKDWNRLVAAAVKEGKAVVLGDLGGEMRGALTDAFKRRYGLSIEVISGRGSEIAAKLLRERAGGLYLADVYLGGPQTPLLTLKPAGVLDPLDTTLVLPEVIDPKVWYWGELRYMDKGHFIFPFVANPSMGIAINTELVKPGEIRSYQDLLEPKWKGRILMNDPTTAGSGLAWFSNTLVFKMLDLAFMESFAQQEPVIVRDQRQQMEWLAQGKYPVATTPNNLAFEEFKKAGAPIGLVLPSEGVHLSSSTGNIALVNKAPHPSSARVFINWLLTREGQTIFSRASATQSARIDVPTDNLPPSRVRDPKVKYPLEDEEASFKMVQNMELARKVFGPLMR